ncbi:MAG: hypothetical protein ACREPR_27165 [Brasilonema sp.]
MNSEIIALLTKIAQSLERLAPNDLGFCQPPNNNYLYVKKEGDFPWYFRVDDKNLPCTEKAIKSTVLPL